MLPLFGASQAMKNKDITDTTKKIDIFIFYCKFTIKNKNYFSYLSFFQSFLSLPRPTYLPKHSASAEPAGGEQ